MKLAQDNNRVFNSLGDVVNPQYQDIVWVNNNAYIYLPSEGGWKLDIHIPYNYFISLVPNDYDFIANNATDVSTLENWDKYGEHFQDYWFVLGYIKAIAIPLLHPNYPTLDFTGWANLTIEQKTVIAKTPYAPPSLRQEIFSTSEDWENGERLLLKSFGIDKVTLTGRKRVAEEMRQWVFLNYVWQYLMDIETSKQFGKDTRQLIDYFEVFSDYDFYNWLTNKVGTQFENDGFLQKNYFSNTYPDLGNPLMLQLKQELLTIYNGE